MHMSSLDAASILYRAVKFGLMTPHGKGNFWDRTVSVHGTSAPILLLMCHCITLRSPASATSVLSCVRVLPHCASKTDLSIKLSRCAMH